MIGSKRIEYLVFFCFLFLFEVIFAQTPPPSGMPITLRPIPVKEKQVLAAEWGKTHQEVANQFARNILRSLPQYATLMVLEDIPTLSLWHLKQQNQLPSSVSIYDFDGAFFKPLPLEIGGDIATFSLSRKDVTIDQIFQVRQSAEKDLVEHSKFPVFSTSRRDTTDLKGFTVIPSGVVYLYWKKGDPIPDYTRLISKIKPLDSYLAADPSPEARNMAAITRYMRGINLMQIRQPWAKQNARVELHQAASLSGDLKGIHVLLAESFLELGDWSAASSSGLIALEKKPDWPKSYYINGDIAKATGNYSSAIDYYLNGIQRDPDNLNSKFTLATLYRKNGELDNALQWFQTALIGRKDNPQILLQMAEVYEAKKDNLNAIELYQNYLKLAPQAANVSDIKLRIQKLKANK